MIRILRIIGCGFIAAVLIPAVLPADELPQENGAARAPDRPADQVASRQTSRSRADRPALADVVETLSEPQVRRDAGSRLKERPEWADMLDRLTGGAWVRGQLVQDECEKYDWDWLAERFDYDEAEPFAGRIACRCAFADLLFARLDRDNDGAIAGERFEHFARQQNTPRCS